MNLLGRWNIPKFQVSLRGELKENRKRIDRREIEKPKKKVPDFGVVEVEVEGRRRRELKENRKRIDRREIEKPKKKVPDFGVVEVEVEVEGRRRRRSGAHPEEGGGVFLHEGVRLGFVLVVEGVEVEVLLVAQEALADEEGRVLAALQLAQKVVVVEAVDLLDVAEDDVALAAHRLRYVLARQLRNVILWHTHTHTHTATTK